MHRKPRIGVAVVFAWLATSAGFYRVAEAQNRNGTSARGTAPGAGSQASAAAAANVKPCVDAFERAQNEQASRNYTAAKEDLLACSQDSCPARVVTACIELLDQVRNEMPQVGFRVTGRAGAELFDVQTTVDDRVLTSKLDGGMFELNPGVHRLQIVAQGYEPFTTSFSVLPGERDRLISAALVSLEKPAPTTSSGRSAPMKAPATSAPAEAVDSSFRIPAATYIAGGVAAIALGGFAYFRLTGASDYDNLVASCSPHCSDAEIDPVRTKYVLSAVSLGVAGAAVATGGLAVLLSGKKKSAQEATTSVQFTGSSAFLRTRF